jgi:hypothetical protein
VSSEQRHHLRLVHRRERSGDVPQPLRADDSRSGHEGAEADLLRARAKPARAQAPGPQARQRTVSRECPDERVGDVASIRVAPADDEVLSGEHGRVEQRLMKAGEHRHYARPLAGHPHDHAAAALHDMLATDVAKLPRHDPRPGAQADERGGAHPARLG